MENFFFFLSRFGSLSLSDETLFYSPRQGSGNKNLAIIIQRDTRIKTTTTNNGTFFCLYRVQMVFLRMIRGRRAGFDVRVFMCFFFLPLTGGGEIARLSQRERKFLLRARRRKSGVVVFAPRCERRSRDFRRDLRFVDIRSRERVELCARGGAMDGSCAFTNRQKGGRGSRSAVFLFFFFFSLSLLTHTKLFLLKKHSHRKRRLKSRRSWARSKSKTARSRNGFA